MALFVELEKQLPEFKLQVSFQTGNHPLGILGASGAGKSMTLRCIAGLETPTRGRIVLNDRVLFDSKKGINLPARERNVGFLFQNYALFPHFTVYENIGFGLKGISKSQQDRKIKEKLAAFCLEGLEDRLPHQLSGGQQQRTALARATILEPQLLLMDEPFSALDNHLRSQMEHELVEVLKGFGGDTLFVTHNLEEAYRICENLLILDNGTKIAYGEKDELFKNPPNYSAAKVTGCNNLSAARAVTSDTVEAVDWGCQLKITGQLPKRLTHVGVRAHHLAFVDNSQQENVFPCWLSHTSQSPHRMTLYLTLNSPPDTTGSYHLQAEVLKEKWELIKDRPFPWLIYLDPNHLFLTREI